MNILSKSKIIKFIVCILLIGIGGHYLKLQSDEQTVLRQQKEQEQQQENYSKWQQQLAKKYNDGIWYISKYNYKFAKDTLSYFYDGGQNDTYKDSQILAIFATAKEWEHAPYINYRQQYTMANNELSKIPKDYNGQFAMEIKVFRDDVQTKLNNYASADKDQQKYKDSHIYVGDSEYKVLQIFGEPKRKNRTAVGNTVREQWVYGNGSYVYIEDGTVTAWQD